MFATYPLDQMGVEIPNFDLNKVGFITANIPREIVERARPLLAEISTVFAWEEDFPHRRAHIIEMLSNLDIIRYDFPESELSPVGFWLAIRTIELHDKGYTFVKKGLIDPRNHHFISVLIADKVEDDSRVLYGILHHVDDTLPTGSPLWLRLVRDLDRVGGMGYTGMIRLAYYMGFNHPSLTREKEEEFIERGILCAFGLPDDEGYEENAKNFFDASVFPYLVEDDNRAIDFCLMAQALIDRFMGDTRAGVEPVMKEVRQLFEIKLRHTVLASESIMERKPLPKNLARRLDIFPYL